MLSLHWTFVFVCRLYFCSVLNVKVLVCAFNDFLRDCESRWIVCNFIINTVSPECCGPRSDQLTMSPHISTPSTVAGMADRAVLGGGLGGLWWRTANRSAAAQPSSHPWPTINISHCTPVSTKVISIIYTLFRMLVASIVCKNIIYVNIGRYM